MKQESVKYNRLIIYFFSGTGNAKNAATWLIRAAEAKGMETELINIDRFESIEVPNTDDKTLIGFCSPTHGFNLPPIILKFIWKFPKVKNADVFILNTRGGFKFLKWFLPGLSGTAQVLPALILKTKGFQVVGMQPLDLPSNWLLLHPGIKDSVVQSIYERCHGIVNRFGEKILSGEKRYKALLSLPIDLAILPITILYYIIGRFFLAKTLIATDACNSCEKCVKQCPVDALHMINERPYWSYTCESCMRCANICSHRAIETAHSFSSLLIVLSSLVISPLLMTLLKYFGAWEWIHQSVIAESLWTLADAFIFILFVFISYRVLHYLMRFSWINKIVSYTSLSHYSFWRRYKAPKVYPPSK